MFLIRIGFPLSTGFPASEQPRVDWLRSFENQQKDVNQPKLIPRGNDLPSVTVNTIDFFP